MDGLNASIWTGQRTVTGILTACLVLCAGLWANELVTPSPARELKIAAVIDCHGTIDEGLYKSIVRRSEEAIEAGGGYIFFDI